MKILVLAPQPFFQNRGTPIAVRLLAEILGQTGHEIHLLVFNEGDDIIIDNVTIHRIPSLPGLGSVTPGFSVKKLLCDILMTAKCFQLQRKIRFDFVHAVEESVFIAMILQIIFKAPYIYDLDSWMSDQLLAKLRFLRPFRTLFEFFEKKAVKRSIGVIPVCLALEQKIRSFDEKKPLVRLEDISLLQEEATGRQEILRESLGIQGKIVMYVGNLEKYQGIDLLIESFSLVDPATFDCCLIIIGGTAEDIRTYTEMSRSLKLGNRVFFIGPRPVTDLGMYLQQADVLVSPRTEGENTPMKIYSYMDSGQPILATRITSHTQVLDEDLAYLVNPEPESMAEGLARILADDGRAVERAGRAKKKVAAEYSRAAYEKKLIHFYNELTHVRNLRV
jgi:glycosyltransferase involved in cell wall biosynthesis